ncbi:glutamine-hydrolyzing carbamoyl-phosphate synthase small subunit [Picrophilus oshimae]|nr:glutamine-hydrolyzing carbamoyl-phosphate synthase small subunit [Picrophilus oshimae]
MENNIFNIEISLFKVYMYRYLILEDGTVYKGTAYGYEGETHGELVFTTSMSGYLETITDPSYAGQILIFAYPEIANYPLSYESMESDRIQVSGLITRDAHAEMPAGNLGISFDEFMRMNKVPGIDGIDTRHLVEKIRRKGVMKAWIRNTEKMPDDFPDTMSENLVGLVSRKRASFVKSGSKRILFIDVGTKNSLINNLAKIASLHIVPYNYDFDSIKDDYDMIFIPNGPGDPAHESLDELRDFIKRSFGSIPVTGVCLGNQIIALAAGARTEKMKFGHRGVNHAVTNGDKIYITSHNHGYAVSRDSLNGTGLRLAGWDINDGTVEMLEGDELKTFSVQFHPEAHPGPYDGEWFFGRLREMLGD